MAFFFLMCSERSGSNFITKVLNGHPDVCGPSTKHVINPVARNFFRYGNLAEKHNWEALLSDIVGLIQVEFSEWRVHFDKDDLVSLAPRGDLPALIKNIFMEEAKANGKVHVFVKENQIYEITAFLLHHFPEAKYIYQVRDPRDMALSWMKNADHKGGIVCAAEQWKKDQMQSLKNHHVMTSSDRSMLIRYEDVLTDFDQTTRDICDFLGVKRSDVMKDFYKDEITRKNAKAIPAWGNLDQGVITSNMNKFEQELTADQIRMVEKICYPEMWYLGYQPKYSRDELDEIVDTKIDEWRQWELSNIEWCPKEAVLQNMAAKRRFYNHTAR